MNFYTYKISSSRKKIKAGALLYAIFISFIIAMISSFLILSAFNYNRYIDNKIRFEQLKSNVNSAINYYLAEPNILETKKTKEIQLFDDDNLKTKLEYKPWGMYSCLIASSHWKHLSFSKKVLLGDDILSTEKTALYLADHNNYLSLCSKTNIKGLVYLPKHGVKRAYIEGKSFSGRKLINGKIQNSKKKLPSIDDFIISYNKLYLDGIKRTTDSVLSYENFIEMDTITNNFENKTLIIEILEDLSLSDKTIIGNIIFLSKFSIDIKSDNTIENLIIYAPNITIENDFKGELQAIVSENIIIKENVNLTYPSSIVLLKNNMNKSEININENSKIEGSVILINQKKSLTNRALLHIHKNANIQGQVYCNDMVQLNGEIFGSLYADMFYLKTASSVYENHLIDATIDISKLSEYYVGVDLFGRNSRKKIIKCLE